MNAVLQLGKNHHGPVGLAAGWEDYPPFDRPRQRAQDRTRKTVRLTENGDVEGWAFSAHPEEESEAFRLDACPEPVEGGAEIP